jgi:hypothetical protein
MELVTIADRSGGRPGLVVGSRIFDLRVGHSSHELSRWRPDSVVGILDAGDDGREQLQALHDALIAEPDLPDLRAAWLPLEGTQLGPPIRRPGLLMSLARTGPDELVPLLRSPNTLAGPEQQIPLPKTGNFFVRPLLAVVIGRRCYEANPAEAAAAVGGVTLALEYSHDVRTNPGPFVADFQSRYLGGQRPGSFVIGPRLKLMSGELDEMISLEINGVAVERWQSPKRSALGNTIARLSTWFGFKPGDLIAIGAEPDRAVKLAGNESVAALAPSLGRLATQLI